MRQMGVRGVLIYCSDIEALFVCKACRTRGADVRPDFSPTQKRA
jgi:hypothetical protein